MGLVVSTVSYDVGSDLLKPRMHLDVSLVASYPS
jgi:hypothetical protein